MSAWHAATVHGQIVPRACPLLDIFSKYSSARIFSKGEGKGSPSASHLRTGVADQRVLVPGQEEARLACHALYATVDLMVIVIIPTIAAFPAVPRAGTDVCGGPPRGPAPMERSRSTHVLCLRPRAVEGLAFCARRLARHARARGVVAERPVQRSQGPLCAFHPPWRCAFRAF